MQNVHRYNLNNTVIMIESVIQTRQVDSKHYNVQLLHVDAWVRVVPDYIPWMASRNLLNYFVYIRNYFVIWGEI